MPYILDGKSISPDAAFTHDGIQYPAGWIKRVSEDSRQEIGLFWQAEPLRIALASMNPDRTRPYLSLTVACCATVHELWQLVTTSRALHWLRGGDNIIM